MPYTIKFSDPTKISTISVPDFPPGINTTSTSLNLPGRGYPNYGMKFAENFIYLLENFANSTPPGNPVHGQLWYDNVNNKLNVNNTSTGARWTPTNGVWQLPRNAPPSTPTVGDLWVNTTDSIVSVYNANNAWTPVGNPPTYTSVPTAITTATSTASSVLIVDSLDNISPLQLVLGPGIQPETSVLSTGTYIGINYVYLNKNFNQPTGGTYSFYTSVSPSVSTGAFPTLLADSNDNLHWVLEHKIRDVPIAIDSAETFSPNPPIANFPFILNTGTTMTTLGKFWGTAQWADGLNLYFGSSVQNISAKRFLIKDDISLPGPGQIITGRVYFQNTDGVVLTTYDDPIGISNGKIQLRKVANNLVISNDINTGEILLNTKHAQGVVKINSIISSKSTNTGALTVSGGVGIGGDLWVGGAAHIGDLVAHDADNIYGGGPGMLLYQDYFSDTCFVNTGTTSTILVANGTNSPIWTNTSTILVGYAANLLSGAPDLFPYQSNTSTTAFITTGNMQVGYAVNVIGGAQGSIYYQSATSTGAFLPLGPPDSLLITGSTSPEWQLMMATNVGSATTATNLRDGTSGQIPYQPSPGITSFFGPGNPGQILVSNGFDSPPSFVGPGSVGQILVSTNDGMTGNPIFIGPGNSSDILVSQGAASPSYVSTSNIFVGRAALANAIYGNPGTNGSLVYQISYNVTGFTQGLTFTSPDGTATLNCDGNITAGGTITASGDVIAGSDRNIKDNIETITNALDKVLDLRGVSFNYKENGKASIGVIAQEVQEILPMIVSTNESTGFLGVSYGAMVGLLIEAIKEQQIQIEELKKKIG